MGFNVQKDFNVQTNTFQLTCHHSNHGNRFRSCGWVMFGKNMFETPFHSRAISKPQSLDRFEKIMNMRFVYEIHEESKDFHVQYIRSNFRLFTHSI